MRAILLAMVVWVSMRGAALAEVSAADQAEIQRVISAQIDAFRRDDGNAAFGFASPGIQRKFGDGGHFLEGVREAYPPVYRPRSFSFGALADAGGAVLQHVEIVGPDGRVVTAVYELEHEADGSWRIAGCSLVTGALTET
jgi:hypothetical protein